jgi:anti-sigma B factor antagonist
VPAAEYPFQMIGRVPVITAPAAIDMTTSADLRAVLFQWHQRGHTTMVVNLTGTVFCDMAGLRELERAHKRAEAAGGGLRLVTAADGPFARIFTITGLDRVIPHFATVEQALAQNPAWAIGSLRVGPARGPEAAPASQPAHLREREGPVAESRHCEQCGAVFVPVREHARFCDSDCRAAWNSEHLGDPVVDANALNWSIVAMSDATARLPAMKVWDKPQAFTAIQDAVWWITMVDATLVRHHSAAYDTVMAGHTEAERRVIYETLAGLRFVRNWISREAGLNEIIETGVGATRITGWTWKRVPESSLGWLPSRAQTWERTRWQAYHVRLSSHTIGNTFSRAATFLTLTGADAAASTDTS